MAKARILIVEDEAIIASVITSALRKFDYEVVDILGSGEEAVAVALHTKPDLLLMDIRLRGDLDGIAAMERIQMEVDIPVIYLTAYADEPTLERAKKTKPYGYIPKPFQEIELKTTIEMALYKHGFEIRLRESEARFRSLFENSQDVIYVIDRAEILVEMNPSGLRLFGYVREELVGKKTSHLYANPRQRDELLASIWEHSSVKNYPVKMKKKSGEAILAQITANVVADASGKISGFQGILRDVTKEKKIEEQMIQLAKVESVGRLAGGIAHDFKNYLTIINGYAEMLLGEHPQGAERESLTTILQAGKNASKLVTKILGFSRLQAATPVTIDVNESLGELEHILRRLLGTSIELRLDLHAESGHVNIDPTQFEQVLINLTLNARDAMPHGGQLALSSMHIDVDEAMAIDHPPLKPGAYAAIHLRDSGTGIEPKVLAHIFEPFFTTKPQGEGTGLGLASVFAIVSQNQGGIWAESAPGQGATFHVLLPQAATTALAERVREPQRRFEGRTALLVEDEREIREFIWATLESLGLEVKTASDGRQALQAADGMPQVDLLFTDVALPGLSGIELAERMSKTRPGMTVIFTSGQGQEYLKRAGLDTSKVNFLEKPATRAAIAALIAKAMG